MGVWVRVQFKVKVRLDCKRKQLLLLHHEHKGHMMSRMMSMRWEREQERKKKKNGATQKRVRARVRLRVKVGVKVGVKVWFKVKVWFDCNMEHLVLLHHEHKGHMMRRMMSMK